MVRGFLRFRGIGMVSLAPGDPLLRQVTVRVGLLGRATLRAGVWKTLDGDDRPASWLGVTVGTRGRSVKGADTRTGQGDLRVLFRSS